MAEGRDDNKSVDGFEGGHDDGFDIDDFDEDELLAAWEEAEQEAAEVLLRGLEDVPEPDVSDEDVAAAAAELRGAARRGEHAATWMLQAAGIDDVDELSDEDLLVEAVAATILMVEEPGLPDEDAATVMALELVDWIGAILGVVREGPGADASPEALVQYEAEMDELDDPFEDPDDRWVVEHGFEIVLPAWQASGAVDAGRRLTELGAWLLPEAAVFAWTDGGMEQE